MNLSRKLRPKTFEEIVGQDLVKAMLKNSLFLDKIFPVYLFSGQRGCGKTTTARIFAKSLNCQALSNFRQNPKDTKYPCLKCVSCTNMESLTHPDFFEIDAASNNGVDNIRQLIETSFYQPALGVRRVFLIDEAHMLSKAAFNALLKILEEPPKTVTFLLATTEMEKIPQTIRSRAFLSFFPSLPPKELFSFLTKVCNQEGIRFDDEALWLLVKQSQGCPRDALNLLEQAFFCEPIVSLKIMEEIFSYCPTKDVLSICSSLFQKNQTAVLKWFLKNKNKYSPNLLFESFQEMFIQTLNYKLEIYDETDPTVYGYDDELRGLANIVDLEFLQSCMRQLWDNQQAFALSVNKESYLEFLITELCLKTGNRLDPERHGHVDGAAVNAAPLNNNNNETPTSPPAPETAAPLSLKPIVTRPQLATEHNPSPWSQFLNSPEIKKHKMLCSSLAAAQNIEIMVETSELLISLPNSGRFVISLLDEARLLIAQILPTFFENIKKIRLRQEVGQKPALSKSNTAAGGGDSQILSTQDQTNREQFDFSDIKQWPKVNLMLKYFPGSTAMQVKKR